MVNILTVCIQITALWDLTTFSLVDYIIYIYMYVVQKPVVLNSGKKH
jgi:hypothetical protein